MAGSPSSASALQRSKSAPSPLAFTFTSTGRGNPNPKTARLLENRAKADASSARRAGLDSRGLGADLEEYVQTRARTRSPLVSPWHDARDDPFSLAGFFPSRPRSPEHAVEWAWRGTAGEAVADEEVGEEELEESLPAPQRSYSMNALDEYARDVIGEESKLGLLGLVRVPSFFKSIGASYLDETEEYDTPPGMALALEEPFDAETLHASMRSRRAASERGRALPEGVPSLGLFSPTSETTTLHQ